MDHLTDAELMELVRGGDFVAFDELYNRHSKPVWRFLFSLTWDQDTADDYLQEVFLRLYKARNRYEPSGKFSNYLFRIAKNYYLAQIRRDGRIGEVSLAQEGRNGCKPFEHIRANERVEPEVRLMEDYRLWRMRQAIKSLPDAQRLVFVMSHIEGMRYEQISDVLRIPVGTVKSRMFAAVRSLRTALQEELS